jgi:hypothetical protein
MKPSKTQVRVLEQLAEGRILYVTLGNCRIVGDDGGVTVRYPTYRALKREGWIEYDEKAGGYKASTRFRETQ